MGTHYATAVIEELAEMMNEYIVVAPSCLNPGALNFFSKNKTGNKILEKLVLKKKRCLPCLKLAKNLDF